MRKGPVQLHSLLHSAELVEKRLATLLSSLGIRPRQARILNVLNRMGAASQVELVTAFDVTPGSMSTMIDRLLKRGLIQRHKNPRDRRGDIVALTPQGAEMVAEVRGVWREVDDMIVEALGAERAAQLHELTRELKIALGGKVAGKGVARRDLDALLTTLEDTTEGETPP